MDKIKSGVLRYLGHRGQNVPQALENMVDECLDLMRATATPRRLSMTFDLSAEENGLSLVGTGLLMRGKGIARHLCGCGRAVLMAATLGAAADALILKWERADLTRCLILDACATRLIEEYCGETEQIIRERASAAGLMATRRFSPGYGDFQLDIQPGILGVLDAGRKIGLTCTPSLMLLPLKSVTAIIGLGKGIEPSPGGCGNCSMKERCRRKG